MAKSDGLFGVALFLMGAAAAASSMSIIVVNVIFPAVVLYQIVSALDFVVSIVAIVASKKYGPKSLISSAVVSGLNTVLRAVAFAVLVLYLFGGASISPNGNGAHNQLNEDASRTQIYWPGQEGPSFTPGTDRPLRPHGPGGPGGPGRRPHGPGGPGECPPLPSDLPPVPGSDDLPPLPSDLPPLPDGPRRPGHCGPGFPGGPGHPGRPGHEDQDPRDDEQEPNQGEHNQHPNEHQGPRRGREEDEQQEPRDHQGPRRGREEDADRESDQHDTDDSDEQHARQQVARATGPNTSLTERLVPYIAFGLGIWAVGLNLSIFIISILHIRRVMTTKKRTPATTSVNGKVYSELSSKV